MAAGVYYRVEGLENRANPDTVPHITMFSHPSNMDPVVMLASSPVVHKMVGKQVRSIFRGGTAGLHLLSPA